MTSEAKVGAAAVAGLLLLAFIIVHIGGGVSKLFDRGYPLYVKFKQVSGLKEGSIVRYSGVDIGQVKKVEIVPGGVQVTLSIDKNEKVAAHSMIAIASDGMMGDKFISIYPPERPGDYLAEGTQVTGMDYQGLESILTSANQVMDDVQILVKSMNDIIGDEKFKTSLKNSAANGEEITANMKQMTTVLARMSVNNQANIQNMITNMLVISESVKEMTDRMNNMMYQLDNHGQSTAEIKETLHNLNQASNRLDHMAATMENLVTDPATTQDIRETLHNVKEASAKANQMLGGGSGMKMSGGAEMLYSPGADSHYQTNFDLRLHRNKQFVLLGASHIGDDSKLNFQLGSEQGALVRRLGLIDGQPGVGLETGNQGPWHFSVDAYDPNDVKLKFRASYDISPSLSLVGQSEELNAARNTYLGLRQSF